MCSFCGHQHSGEVWCDERTLEQYRNLAFSIINQFSRTYRLPATETPDFEQHMLSKLIQAPQSYRTSSAGVYTILKNVAIKFVQKHKRVALDSLDGLKIPDGVNHEAEFTRALDREMLTAMLDSLPGPERVCISMHFGIGHPCAFSIYAISKRLGASTDWVERKILRAKVLLKRRLKLDSLQEERVNHA